LAILLRSRTAPRSFPNRTPWDTFRKEDEDALGERLQKMTSRVTAPPERTIYDFHCQPYGSGLDDALELTEDLRPEDAGRSIGSVGSKGVRETIEEGQLLGAMVNLDGENKVKRFVLTSG
jgi:uncharacterized protein